MKSKQISARVCQEDHIVQLSGDSARKFYAAIEHPPAPSETLKAAAATGNVSIGFIPMQESTLDQFLSPPPREKLLRFP